MSAPITRSMVLERTGAPLRLRESPRPRPGAGEVLLAVNACGVCRTDLHIVDGEVAARLPVVPGHQIVGTVLATGPGVAAPVRGARVGVPWLGATCGTCAFCREGRENLCDDAVFTGCHVDGGFATHVTANARSCLALPDGFDDLSVAPLLCAGLIGYRALRLAGGGERLGLYGFGAAAHILAQVAVHQGREVYAFTRSGDTQAQGFARSLGATWAGGSDEPPPALLDAAIIFAPAGELVPVALTAVRKGGTVVCAGIHMSPIPAFAYERLWGERIVRSVANLTRRDAEDFLAIAPAVPVRTQVVSYEMERANEALLDLREGRIEGAAVLTMPL